MKFNYYKKRVGEVSTENYYCTNMQCLRFVGGLIKSDYSGRQQGAPVQAPCLTNRLNRSPTLKYCIICLFFDVWMDKIDAIGKRKLLEYFPTKKKWAKLVLKIIVLTCNASALWVVSLKVTTRDVN